MWSCRPLRPCLSVCRSVSLYFYLSIFLSVCLRISMIITALHPSLDSLCIYERKGSWMYCDTRSVSTILNKNMRNHWPGKNVKNHRICQYISVTMKTSCSPLSVWHSLLVKRIHHRLFAKFIAIITLACFSISCKPLLTRTFKWSHIVFADGIFITVIRTGVLTLVTIYTNRRKIKSFTSMIYGTFKTLLTEGKLHIWQLFQERALDIIIGDQGAASRDDAIV